MNPNQKHWVRMLSDVLNVTTTIVASIFLGLWLGQWLDSKFPLPWLEGMFFTIIGFLLGVITAGRVLWVKGIKEWSDSNGDKNKQNQSGHDDKP